MRLFSHRHGYEKIREDIQTDSFDSETENKLWDIICLIILEKSHMDEQIRRGVQNFICSVYTEVLKKPVDEALIMYDMCNRINTSSYEKLRCMWFNDFPFNRQLDVIELLTGAFSNTGYRKIIVDRFNNTFKQMLVAYRINENGQVIRIDSEEEYKEIGKAVEGSDHINNAVKKLYDRENSDYRNSIKESILAVEEVCRSMGSDNKFSKSLEVVSERFNLHPLLKKSLLSLYGFCSDEKGIRHSGNTKSDIDFEEAKLILVVCSALTNYLREKKVKMNN